MPYGALVQDAAHLGHYVMGGHARRFVDDQNTIHLSNSAFSSIIIKAVSNQMFPLSDDAPRSTTPYVNYLLIALNTIVFLFEVSLTPRQEAAFVAQFAF